MLHKYLHNEWMDGQTRLSSGLGIFGSWNFSSVHMGPSGFCQTVSLALGSRLAGARGTGFGGWGAGGEREEETAEFTKAAH